MSGGSRRVTGLGCSTFVGWGRHVSTDAGASPGAFLIAGISAIMMALTVRPCCVRICCRRHMRGKFQMWLGG